MIELHNTITVDNGRMRVTAGNRINAAKALRLTGENRGYLNYIKLSEGTPSEMHDCLTQAAVSSSRTEITEYNYNVECGALFVTARAVWGEELPAGTLAGEFGFSDNAALDTDTVNAVNFNGNVCEKLAGVPLTVEGTVFLSLAPAEDLELFGGENALVRLLLARAEENVSFQIEAYDLLARGADTETGEPEQLFAAQAALTENAAAWEIAGTAALPVRDFLLLLNGVPVARGTKRRLGNVLTEQLSEDADVWESGQSEIAEVSCDLPAPGRYSLITYPRYMAKCLSLCGFERLAEGDSLYAGYDGKSYLVQNGARFALYTEDCGRLTEENASGIDIAASEVTGVCLAQNNALFLLLAQEPYLAVYARENNAFTRLTLSDTRLFRGAKQLALTQNFPLLVVKKLVGLRWHITEYGYHFANGKVYFTLLEDAEYLEPKLYVDRISGYRLYVDTAAKRFRYLDNAGLSYRVHESLHRIILTKKDILADEKYLYVLSPSLKAYNIATGEAAFSSGGEEGHGAALCMLTMSPDKRFYASLYADGRMELYRMDAATATSVLLGGVETSGKVRGIRFFGNSVLAFADGGEAKQLFMLYGTGARLTVLERGEQAPRITYRRLLPAYAEGDLVGVSLGAV